MNTLANSHPELDLHIHAPVENPRYQKMFESAEYIATWALHRAAESAQAHSAERIAGLMKAGNLAVHLVMTAEATQHAPESQLASALPYTVGNRLQIKLEFSGAMARLAFNSNIAAGALNVFEFNRDREEHTLLHPQQLHYQSTLQMRKQRTRFSTINFSSADSIESALAAHEEPDNFWTGVDEVVVASLRVHDKITKLTQKTEKANDETKPQEQTVRKDYPAISLYSTQF